MRKFQKTLVLVAALLLCMATSAKDNPLRLKSGSLAPLKGKGGSIVFVFDLSKTRGNRKPLEQHLREDFGTSIQEFKSKEPDMRKWFADRWNDDIEDGPKFTTDEQAPFVAKVFIRNLQMGARSGYGGASISGYAEFYRQGEAEPFAVVEILKLAGTQMGTPIAGYLGLQQVFNDLAEYLCDLIFHY